MLRIPGTTIAANTGGIDNNTSPPGGGGGAPGDGNPPGHSNLPAHRQERRPSWLALSPEIKQEVLKELDMHSLSSFKLSNRDGYCNSMMTVNRILTEFNQELENNGWRGSPEQVEKKQLASSITDFRKRLVAAGDNPSAELRNQKQRWENATQKPVAELADLAQSVLDKLSNGDGVGRNDTGNRQVHDRRRNRLMAHLRDRN